MRNKLYKISTAILALAITFIFSCSSGDGGGGGCQSSSENPVGIWIGYNGYVTLTVTETTYTLKGTKSSGTETHTGTYTRLDPPYSNKANFFEGNKYVGTATVSGNTIYIYISKKKTKSSYFKKMVVAYRIHSSHLGRMQYALTKRIIRLFNVSSWKSLNPENPGSDKINAVVAMIFSIFQKEYEQNQRKIFLEPRKTGTVWKQ